MSTHVASSVVAERPPAMCGRATEAMEVSKTSINVGSITAAAINQGLQSGHQSCIGFWLVSAKSINDANSGPKRKGFT